MTLICFNSNSFHYFLTYIPLRACILNHIIISKKLIWISVQKCPVIKKKQNGKVDTRETNPLYFNNRPQEEGGERKGGKKLHAMQLQKKKE